MAVLLGAIGAAKKKTTAKVGQSVYAYFHYDFGYNLVGSPAMGEPYDGKVIGFEDVNGVKKYVIKFVNGETKKLSQGVFNDYIYLNK